MFIIIKLATNSPSWLYYTLLVIGRERQHCSLETTTCEPRLFELVNHSSGNSKVPGWDSGRDFVQGPWVIARRVS